MRIKRKKELIMNKYIIYTDSACDIKPEMLEEWGVKSVALTFRFNGEDKEYGNNDMDISEFYGKMRSGAVAKTAAANSETFRLAFLEEVEKGNDVLYLGFSSGLSTTFNSARIAAEAINAEHGARVTVIDTLSASAGFGMLVYLAKEKKNSGASLAEVAEYIKETIPHMCHWFTVDDLEYLKRGGRVSGVTAFVGNLLGIKPVLHMDNEGHLIKRDTVRGRKKSIIALADMYDKLAVTPDEGTVFICQADCSTDADALAALVKERHGVDVKLIVDTGTVIGAHSGPGTLALFFIGKER